MTKIINSDWVMEKDEEVEEDLVVDGSISGEEGEGFSLKVKGDIKCGDIQCGDIQCEDIYCRDIKCGNIYCRDIKCGDINCRDIYCRDIKCGGIECGNIKCEDIKCGDIDCSDITCWDIKAKKIAYTAFCIAYNNIECESIEGRRENAFHKALDGEVRIKKKDGGGE